MGDKVEFSDLTQPENSSFTVSLNNKLQELADEFDKVVYRDGTAPNFLTEDLDLNGKNLLNIGADTANQFRGLPGSPGQGYPSRVAIASVVDPIALDDAYLSEPGLEGMFIFRSGDYTTQVASEPDNYIAPAASPTGVDGAWERVPFTDDVARTDAANAVATSTALAANLTAGTFPFTNGVASAQAAYRYAKPGDMLVPGSGAEIFTTTEANAGDAHYWGREYSGVKATGANPSTNLAYGPVGYMFDLRTDTADAGSDFVRVLYGRSVFGGANAKGGRVGVLGQVQQDSATSATNTNRDYIGGTFQSYSFSGDGGTNLTDGAKGRYYGFNAIALLGAGATNAFEVTGGEVNTYTHNTASTRHLWGLSVCGMNGIRGAETDAAIEIGNAVDAGVYGGRSWKHGILFSNVHGLSPVENDSVLLGSYWNDGVPRTILHGIDLGGFNVTGALIQGRAAYLTENQLTLGANGSNISAIYGGNGVTNGTIALVAKGTGQAVLTDGGGVSRVVADSGVGVSFIPKSSATPTVNGQMTFEATSNTSLTIRMRGTDGVVRSTTLTLV